MTRKGRCPERPFISGLAVMFRLSHSCRSGDPNPLLTGNDWVAGLSRT